MLLVTYHGPEDYGIEFWIYWPGTKPARLGELLKRAKLNLTDLVLDAMAEIANPDRVITFIELWQPAIDRYCRSSERTTIQRKVCVRVAELHAEVSHV